MGQRLPRTSAVCKRFKSYWIQGSLMIFALSVWSYLSACLCKHKDLNGVPSIHIKKTTSPTGMYYCIPLVRGAKTHASLGLADRPAYHPAVALSRSPWKTLFSKHKEGSFWGRTPMCTHTNIWTYRHVRAAIRSSSGLLGVPSQHNSREEHIVSLAALQLLWWALGLQEVLQSSLATKGILPFSGNF